MTRLTWGASGDGSSLIDQARGGTGDDLIIGGTGGSKLFTGGGGKTTRWMVVRVIEMKRTILTLAEESMVAQIKRPMTLSG